MENSTYFQQIDLSVLAHRSVRIARIERVEHTFREISHDSLILVGPDETSLKEPSVILGASDTTSYARRQIGIEFMEVVLLPRLRDSIVLPEIAVVDQHVQVILRVLNLHCDIRVQSEASNDILATTY